MVASPSAIWQRTSNKKKTVVKCFMAPVFMNEEPHTINSLLLLWITDERHLDNGFSLIERNHYVIIVIMISGSGWRDE